MLLYESVLTVSFLSYPGAVDFDKKIPENVMHVRSNFFVALVVMIAFTHYFLARLLALGFFLCSKYVDI